ncbi:TetR/AcrR family transcriptional regulator [Govanella unica]|uniref:TetR/AcrR family transcriptional regulator n=1 Tax=Govanella unica TaxID=2975056 RepID=A0A9X3TZA9_9PROT|nr:TetR/AcrR family transcriptional regulator [Govania unica]MDA5194548.1 TetR/AcrR family transcriptional regulator [Govania unica]
MATAEAQTRIIETAVSLFNAEGVKAVSVNRIAAACGISRGHLHYHFRTKEDLIATIFERLAQEAAEDAGKDLHQPTLAHMRVMFERYTQLVWRYRFFFRELTALTNRDPLLCQRYFENRIRRLAELETFFRTLVASGLLRAPVPPATIPALVHLSWIVCDNWLAFSEAGGDPLDATRLGEGYDLIMALFAPYIVAP